MLTDERFAEVQRQYEKWAAECVGVRNQQHAEKAENLARRIPELLAEIERLRGLLAEVYPQHYGMLCELWGAPDKWPTYGAAGAVLHEKMRIELGYGEAK